MPGLTSSLSNRFSWHVVTHICLVKFYMIAGYLRVHYHTIDTEGLIVLSQEVLSPLQTKKAMTVGRPGRISVEDIIFLIRKDPKKYSRVKELLIMSEELRKARKAFDEIKYVNK